jgi:hypothetical protein
VKTNLTVPIQNLLDLPPSASFSNRNGRANVAVSRDGDNIYITASCDSLQALVEYYEKEVVRIRADARTEEKTTKNERSTGIQSPFKLIFYGFVAGIVLTIIITLKIKKK